MGKRMSFVTLYRVWGGGGGCNIQALLSELRVSTPKGLWL